MTKSNECSFIKTKIIHTTFVSVVIKSLNEVKGSNILTHAQNKYSFQYRPDSDRIIQITRCDLNIRRNHINIILKLTHLCHLTLRRRIIYNNLRSAQTLWKDCQRMCDLFFFVFFFIYIYLFAVFVSDVYCMRDLPYLPYFVSYFVLQTKWCFQ